MTVFKLCSASQVLEAQNKLADVGIEARLPRQVGSYVALDNGVLKVLHLDDETSGVLAIVLAVDGHASTLD